jgi:hypothetical protein
MPTSWEKMTAEEKVERLRSDLKNTMTSVNMLIQHQTRLGEQLRAIQRELTELRTIAEPQRSFPETNPA